MKKRILSILLVLLTLSAAGCRKEPEVSSLCFYYPRKEMTYTMEESVIAPDYRSDLTYQSAKLLLSVYLQGPLDPELRNPFPEGVTVVSVYTHGNVTYITLSEEFAQLTGVPLILACTSLGKTCMGLLSTEATTIRCESQLLDGKRSITIDENNVIFNDTLPGEIETTEQE